MRHRPHALMRIALSTACLTLLTATPVGAVVSNGAGAAEAGEQHGPPINVVRVPKPAPVVTKRELLPGNRMILTFSDGIKYTGDASDKVKIHAWESSDGKAGGADIEVAPAAQPKTQREMEQMAAAYAAAGRSPEADMAALGITDLQSRVGAEPATQAKGKMPGLSSTP